MKVAAIVEGDGEVAALPILLRRLSEWRTRERFVDVLQPIRIKRHKVLNRPDELNRYLQLAASKCGDGGWVLVLIDADDDCPAELAQKLLNDASARIPHRRVSVVLANREFEAWFIAAARSLDGVRGFALGADDVPVAAEERRDAKGWIRARMAGGAYGVMTDQPGFTAHMSLEQAFQGSRSFRKLCTEWDRQMGSS